jgi:hypothetical protein
LFCTNLQRFFSQNSSKETLFITEAHTFSFT